MTPEGGRKRSPAVQSNAAAWAWRRDQAHSLASHLLLVRTPPSDSPRTADPPPPAAGRRGSLYPVGPRHRPSELCGPFVFTTFPRGPASSVSLGNCLLAGSASKLDVTSCSGLPGCSARAGVLDPRDAAPARTLGNLVVARRRATAVEVGPLGFPSSAFAEGPPGQGLLSFTPHCGRAGRSGRPGPCIHHFIEW